jgi:hypothetical protein
MEITENISLNWSEKVPSNSAVRNPLGIWYHLNIQTEFLPGITSVTRRIRYYTLLAWYWDRLFKKTDKTTTDFEKIFLLATLNHHAGDYDHPSMYNVFNKTRFGDGWGDIDEFDLKFKINGFGRTYYSRQLEVLRMAWVDQLGKNQISTINKKAADTIGLDDISVFHKKKYRKNDLKKIQKLCICHQEANKDEIEIFSKLFFGFFSKEKGLWDIDEDEYKSFQKSDVDLDFEKYLEKDPRKRIDEEFRIRGYNLIRRNTILLFLKIIKETSPTTGDLNFRRYIWDAIYFKQNRDNRKRIKFGRLEKIMEYWEYFQLNLYFVYAIEMVLDLVQYMVGDKNGIDKNSILDELDEDEIEQEFKDQLGRSLSYKDTLSDLIGEINNLNGGKSNLNSPINESQIFEYIRGAKYLEDQLVGILILLCLVHLRNQKIKDHVKEYRRSSGEELKIPDRLNLEYIMGTIDQRKDEITIQEFISNLIQDVIKRHQYESANRFFSNGTKNWIFTEEENRLYFARSKYVDFNPRDNRWGSLRSLLLDLKFLRMEDNRIKLTSKGIEWLRKIE